MLKAVQAGLRSIIGRSVEQSECLWCLFAFRPIQERCFGITGSYITGS